LREHREFGAIDESAERSIASVQTSTRLAKRVREPAIRMIEDPMKLKLIGVSLLALAAVSSTPSVAFTTFGSAGPPDPIALECSAVRMGARRQNASTLDYYGEMQCSGIFRVDVNAKFVEQQNSFEEEASVFYSEAYKARRIATPAPPGISADVWRQVMSKQMNERLGRWRYTGVCNDNPWRSKIRPRCAVDGELQDSQTLGRWAITREKLPISSGVNDGRAIALLAASHDAITRADEAAQQRRLLTQSSTRVQGGANFGSAVQRYGRVSDSPAAPMTPNAPNTPPAPLPPYQPQNVSGGWVSGQQPRRDIVVRWNRSTTPAAADADAITIRVRVNNVNVFARQLTGAFNAPQNQYRLAGLQAQANSTLQVDVCSHSFKVPGAVCSAVALITPNARANP
jgi:hypothetical protein